MPILSARLVCLLLLPVPVHRISRFVKPLNFVSQLFQRYQGKVFDRIRWRMSQWFQQTRPDEDGNIMRLETEVPRC